MSHNEVEFAVFCVENVADHLKKNPADIYQLLAVKSNLLFEYIVPSYEPLHTQSKEYIVNDIVDMMKQNELI